MLKIRPGYDTVTKTLRLPEGMTLKLESIAKETRFPLPPWWCNALSMRWMSWAAMKKTRIRLSRKTT